MTESLRKTQSRNGWIKFIAFLLGTLIGLLLVWLILKVSPKDTWTLTKGVFTSEEKLGEYLPKLDEVDNKLKSSIVATPLNWISKKHEEQITQELSKGNLGAVVNGIRTYCIILIVIWLIVWAIIYTIFYYLSRWIISSFVWKEPTLLE